MKEIVFFIALIAVSLGAGFGVKHLNDIKMDHERTHAVCDYLGGSVHGDLCIKNNQVVGTRHQ